jgi:hypothetical protein
VNIKGGRKTERIWGKQKEKNPKPKLVPLSAAAPFPWQKPKVAVPYLGKKELETQRPPPSL